MKGSGETALYDAIKAGIEITDEAEAEDDNAIRAVVVLTDGQANRGSVELDDLIEMTAASEIRIARFTGFVDDPLPVDISGRTVQSEDVTGTGMVLDTKHDIQIFFIGIGDDADLKIGRMLSEATGAEFLGVTEEDLANVLEEFSGYF